MIQLPAEGNGKHRSVRSEAVGPLLVEDVRLVRQSCTSASVEFADLAVADFFDEQVDAGLPPMRFARIWIHTHPGESPSPSGTDERTFARVFGGCDWAVMAILARGGASYARLRFAAGPGGELVIPVEVDFGYPFAAGDPEAWQAEYAQCVFDAQPITRDAAAEDRPRLADLAAATVEPHFRGASRFPFLDPFELELWEDQGDYGV